MYPKSRVIAMPVIRSFPSESRGKEPRGQAQHLLPDWGVVRLSTDLINHM
jgi:hypothetical protein